MYTNYNFVVFGLLDPKTKKFRFVGKSKSSLDRAYQFKAHAKTRKGPLYDWIRSIDGKYEVFCFGTFTTEAEMDKLYLEKFRKHNEIEPLFELMSRGERNLSKSNASKKKVFDAVFPYTRKTNKEIAYEIGISERQVCANIKSLISEGSLFSEVAVRRFKDRFQKLRKLTVVQYALDAISETKVSSEADGQSRPNPPEYDSVNPEDLF